MKLLRPAAFVAAIALAACFSNGAAAQKSVLQEVKDRGSVRIVDEKGETAGFEIDLAKEIAKRLGVKLEQVTVTSATRIPMLQQGRVDLVAATMTHYRKRDEVIDFSIGYFYSPQTLLVKKSSGIKSLADMAGKRAGTTVGAGSAENFKKAQPKGTLQTFEGYPESFLALQQGLVDAVATDVIILANLRATAQKPDDYEIVGKAGWFAGGDYALGVRENDSKWRDQINFILQDIWVDGTWDKIFEKWLGSKSKIGLTKEEVGFQMEIWNE
jgi:polar amino acid transport system substrate-binding protein